MSTDDPRPHAPALPRSTPEAQGVPSAAVLAMVRRWEGRGLEPHGLTLLRHGHLVAEATWAPYRPDEVQLVYSVSKTVTACAVGFAVDEGLLSLEDHVVDLFPEAAHAAGPRTRALTLHDLLAMRTGHRVDTLVRRAGPPASFPATFLAQEPEEEPGWFVYHNGATLMAALAVQQHSGEPLLDYLRPRLLGPLGVEDAAWTSEGGLALGYSGLHVTTEALARLGELVLRGGTWQGRPVLPAGWAERMTTLHTDTAHHPETADWQQGYGYQMWRCRHDAVRADGAYGQFAVVVPGQDLVVAVTSCTERTQETLDAIWEELLPELAADPLPADDAAHRALTEHLASRALPATPSQGTAPGPGPWRFAHEPTEELPGLRALEVRRAGDAWTLVVEDDLGRLEVPCGGGAWPTATEDHPWVATGGWTAEGAWRARVVATHTPHSLLLRCAGGRAEAAWNGVPLQTLHLPVLRAPRS